MPTRSHRLRARWERYPLASDVVLALVVTAVSVSSLWAAPAYADERFRDPDALGVVLTAAACLPLALRRRYPLPTLDVTGVFGVALVVLSYPSGQSSVAILIALYTVAAACPLRSSLLSLLIVLVVLALVIVLDPFPSTIFEYVAAGAVVFGAWMLGRAMKLRRAYVGELELRAQRLEQAREADLRAGVAEERARIARELHDVVAHSLSVVTVQAAAAQRMLPRSPERSREAMAAVEATGRAALAEMRRVVGVLGAGRGDGHPRRLHERLDRAGR